MPRHDFATWADGRDAKRLRMEDFYRWQRTRLDNLPEMRVRAGVVRRALAAGRL